MIRINLLAVERTATRKKLKIPEGQELTFICGAILIGGAALIGLRFWSLRSASAKLDVDIAAARQETERMRSVLAQVQQFEQQKTELQQRVALIEQLRKEQTGPVHLLDEISRSLPSTLWLSELKELSDGSVLIDGRCTSMTSVSDFVVNLESTGYFKRSIEIVSSTTEPLNQPPGELVKFTIKATFQPPGAKPPPAKQGQKQAG
jgi:type IV pilus assembly protein PilN